MTTAKFSDFLTPFPSPLCHVQNSCDLVPFVCFLGPPSPHPLRTSDMEAPKERGAIRDAAVVAVAVAASGASEECECVQRGIPPLPSAGREGSKRMKAKTPKEE